MRHAGIQLPTKQALRSTLLHLMTGMLLTGAANSGEVFKWTDSAGKIHYGDKPTGGIKATRLDVITAPATETPSVPNTTVVHDGGYSDTLNTCLSNGGANDECVAQASAAQANKAAADRALEEAARERSRAVSNQPSSSIYQPTGTADSETARRAAALAAERARKQRERFD